MTRYRTLAPLLLILALGAALRLYQIGIAPPGLYRDEAYYGLDAAGILRGELAVWFPANNGREGLFMYLLAASIAAFGQNVFALRITSALVGIASIAAIYVAGRAMFTPRIGALSAAMLAMTFWHVAISRVAYRAITLPLLLCLTVAALFMTWRATQPAQQLRRAALTGVLFGLTFYTYTSAQMLLPLCVCVLLGLLINARRVSAQTPQPGLSGQPKAVDGAKSRIPLQSGGMRDFAGQLHLTAFAVFGGVALLTLAPLLIFAATHSDVYFARAGQVSILSPEINQGDLPGALLRNIGKSFGMFLSEGDRIWRHNLSLRPVFDTLPGMAFVAGIAVCIWRIWQQIAGRSGETRPEYRARPALFLLAWLGLFLLPTILAEDTPHFLRGIGALPAACMLCAVGLESVLRAASKRGILTQLYIPRLSRLLSPPVFYASLLIGITGYNTYQAYFNDYVKREQTAYWLEAHNVALAESLNRMPEAANWVDKRLSDENPALRFLAQRPFEVIDPLAPPVAPLPPLRILLDPNHDTSAVRTALPGTTQLSFADGPLAQGDRDPQPRVSFVSIHAEPLPAPATSFTPVARFEYGITLIDATPQMGDSARAFPVQLRWLATQQVPEDIAVFVHWRRNNDPAPFAQHDGNPAGGRWPTPFWRVSDVIVDSHPLSAPDTFKTGDQIVVGLYRRSDNRRLNVLDAQGNPIGDYAIIVR
jgi:uncharacterized membrane protein YuzA (DUF378 family)